MLTIRIEARHKSQEVINVTDITELKPIESKGVDLSQFEGRRIQIESAEVITVQSKFSNKVDGQAEVLRVQSEPVSTMQDRDGNQVPLRASELFNLTRNEEGELGRPTGAKGKLAKFMKKLGAKHPSELVGKEATVRIRTKQGADGMTREFLGFLTE